MSVSPSRIAVVTGAGSGIGRAVTAALFADGWSVVLAGRRAAALNETATLARKATAGSPRPSRSASLSTQGDPSGKREEEGKYLPRLLAIPTDVTDPQSVSRLFVQTVEAFGRVDLLFNNAGINIPGTAIDEISLSDWQRVVDVNLTGAFLCLREAFRVMKSQNPRGGRIINNGSISADRPRPKSIAYTATKHAITGLTKSAILDGRPDQIACGQIDIGNAGTEMTDKMQHGVPQANGTLAVEPTFDVNHVARAVIYMASLPLEANVPFMTVMATAMPLYGRG